MVLTVTLNPLLERRLSYSIVRPGTIHRGCKEVLKPGGKGINVSRQLNKLKIDNIALTFLGGHNGKSLRELLKGENISFSSVSTRSESRYAAIIISESENSITSYFSNDPEISSSEADEFCVKLEKMISNCEIVVFSGSSPCKETDRIVPFGISIANKLGKISVLDTYGRHLPECIANAPTVIHNNIEELEDSLNTVLKTPKQKKNLLESFYSKGIKQCFLTNGSDTTFVSNFDFHYTAENPSIDTLDPTGSGDAFVAGIVYGWHHDLKFENTLKIASSLGAANALSRDVCNVNFEEAEKLLNSVSVIPTGKKIKVIDDTPDY